MFYCINFLILKINFFGKQKGFTITFKTWKKSSDHFIKNKIVIILVSMYILLNK